MQTIHPQGEEMKFKKKNGRYCCDVDGCRCYAYAELYRVTGKHKGWMYVCKNHYRAKLRKARVDDAKDRIFRGYVVKHKRLGFCFLKRRK